MSLAKYVSFATKSFTLPDICLRIRAILDDHRSDAEDIARLISVDPSLTAKILRLANSALFRFPSQIGSITKAVNVIGGEALYNLVVAETANTAFRHFESDLIVQEKHWHESVYCGMVAKYLAKQCRLRGSERFFVMGILQNLSELVVAHCSSEQYKAYLDDNEALLPWEKQYKHFNFTFAECSGTIMEVWKLPFPLYFPVTNMHNPVKQAAEVEVALLACALRITLKENQRDKWGNIELFTPQTANTLMLAGETPGNAVEFANKETDKVASLVK